MKGKIRRNLALKELDIKENPDGSARVFSIVFVTQSGNRVFLPRAVSTGLRHNMSIHRHRGILPVDSQGNKNGHVYPVNIDLIIELNSKEIVL